MFLGAWEGHHRSLAKAISWRLAGSLDTLVLSYLVTKNLVFAGSIASAETITKIVLYYAHERAWTLVPWGKSSRKRRHPLSDLRLNLRLRIRQSVVTMGYFVAHLKPNPAKLGAIGSFVICFAIVMTPPQFWFQSAMDGSVAPEKQYNVATSLTGSIGEAAKQIAIFALPDEALGHAQGKAEPTQPVANEAPLKGLTEKLPVETPRRNLFKRDHTKEVQQRLIELGYLSVSATGIWGPMSRKALRAFKEDHNLAADETWDEVTERNLFNGKMEKAEPFVGIWGINASVCSPWLNRKGFLPAVIDGRGAWAGETFCAFERKQRTTDGWNVVATCSNGHDRWTANVRLMVNGDQLTWSSERGSQSYLRCQPGLRVTRAS
jgi:uncharacterized membrane protein